MNLSRSSCLRVPAIQQLLNSLACSFAAALSRRSANIWSITMTSIPSSSFRRICSSAPPSPTCILVLKASKKDNKTLFIDASAEFVRGGNKNKLTDENRARILKAFTARKDDDHFAQQNEMRTAIDVIVAEIDAIR
jgi:hypothetical protein